MTKGDKIYWDTVNKTVGGILVKEQGDKNWLVLLDNGKYVVVNESSFKNG